MVKTRRRIQEANTREAMSTHEMEASKGGKGPTTRGRTKKKSL